MKTLICFFLMGFNFAFGSQVLKFSDLKKLSESTTAQYAFDEAINLSANFGVNQLDPELRPYFSPIDGKSELCVPTTLSQFIIYQMAVTKKLPITTNVPGVSSDLQTIDANALIIDLSKRCKTDYAHGTNGDNLMICLGDVFSDYFGKKVAIKRIMKSDQGAYPAYVNWENRIPDLLDIREALKNGSPVIGSVGWNSIDPQTKKWVYSSGHVFGIYGYSWEKYFQDNILQLNIMDPYFVWSTSQEASLFNIASAIRHRDDPASSIFLDGRGFNGQNKRGFLGSLTIIDFN
ncbi:MAG: hypothetical protein ACXVLQ_17030 [Bacteriovorax sp.]